jgi:glutamine synthetase|tara:strand:+ start:76547 stop:78154 length:1608 start_codon:yes stop_codon:yes gene_type:complete
VQDECERTLLVQLAEHFSSEASKNGSSRLPSAMARIVLKYRGIKQGGVRIAAMACRFEFNLFRSDSMSASDVLKMISDNDVRYVDFRFTDTKGKEHHVTVPASTVDEAVFENGKMFDGSSIEGWKGINESDMVLMPEAATAVMDPFFADSTLILRCDILEPTTMEGYERDPRSVAKRAEAYLNSTGIADTAYFGPEPEFFVFDDVRWNNSIGGASFAIDSDEASWNTNKQYEDGNTGHRPSVKGGYFPVPPVDSLQDVRGAMCQVLEEMGVEVEVHHHEVGTAGQCEIGTRFDTLTVRADQNQILKYAVLNVAHNYGKTATFMPKPLVGDNGSGMHVHQSLFKDGENLFAGDGYGNLSQTALYYIGGILKHAKAINAFANGSTNSYKRLVPGFEAPVMLAYSARNRSASIRIPFEANAKARRIEVRFGDAAANPYLTFAAMMMAGLDGIQNQIDPGAAQDKDLYDLPPEEDAAIPKVAASLDEALAALNEDRAFLTNGGVFTDDMIDAYINLKMEEVTALRQATHPIEFEMYYSC